MEIQNRREFLRNTGRIAMLGVLVFIPGYLISKKRVSVNPENCDLSIQCNNCRKKSNCNLIKGEGSDGEKR